METPTTSVYTFSKKKGPHHLCAMRNSTLRCFKFARPLPSTDDSVAAASTMPAYMPAKPATALDGDITTAGGGKFRGYGQREACVHFLDGTVNITTLQLRTSTTSWIRQKSWLRDIEWYVLRVVVLLGAALTSVETS